MSMLTMEMFMEFIEPITESGCWIWAGTITPEGYGKKGRIYAHRYSYETFKEPIPNGLQIDHRCRVRCCVNPDHLQVVTSKKNTLLGISPTAQNARKTHCKYGHEFTEENTYPPPPGRGRRCKACCRAALRKARLEKKPWTLWEHRKKS